MKVFRYCEMNLYLVTCLIKNIYIIAIVNSQWISMDYPNVGRDIFCFSTISFMEFPLFRENDKTVIGINISDTTSDKKRNIAVWVLCYDTCLYVNKTTWAWQHKKWIVKNFLFIIGNEFPLSLEYLICEISKLACILQYRST